LVFLFYLVFKEPAARRFARSAQRLSTSGRPEIRAANRSRRLRTASNLGPGWTRERTGAEIVASVRLAGSFRDSGEAEPGSFNEAGVGSFGPVVGTGARPVVGPDL